MRKIKFPYIGELILVSQWSDRNYNDPYAIGKCNSIFIDNRGVYYKVEGSDRWYKHAFRIKDKDCLDTYLQHGKEIEIV